MIPLTLKTCERAECLNLHHAITVNHCTAAEMWGRQWPPPSPRNMLTVFDRTCDCSVVSSFLEHEPSQVFPQWGSWLASTDVCKFKTVITGGKWRFTESNKNCIWQARSVLPLYTFKISESDGKISVLLSAWTFPTASRCSHLSAFLFIHLKFWIWRTL